jgi:acyl carrier protein
MSPGVAHVKALIVRFLRRGTTSALVPATIPDAFDLRVEGLVDSLGFLQLVAHLELELGFEIDFSDLDPEHLTIFGRLSSYIAERWAQAQTVDGQRVDVAAVTRSTP